MCQILVNSSAVKVSIDIQAVWIYYAVDILEILLSLCSAIFVGFGLYVFYCSPLFNRNLILLVYTMAMSFYGILISRMAVIFMLMSKSRAASSLIHFFSCVPDIQMAQYARIAFIGSYLSALACISIERFIATVQLSTYEKQNNFRFIWFSIAFQICAFWIAFTARLYNLVPFEYTVLGSTFFNLIIFFFFVCVENINYRWYKNAQCAPIGLYTLSERFQLSENVRTSRILKEVLILCCTLNVVCQAAVFIVLFSNDVSVRQVGVTVVNFLIIFYGIIFVATPMYRIGPYKKKTIQLLQSFRCFNTVGLRESNALVLFDITGNPMTFNANEEARVYFDDLIRQWQ